MADDEKTCEGREKVLNKRINNFLSISFRIVTFIAIFRENFKRLKKKTFRKYMLAAFLSYILHINIYIYIYIFRYIDR